MREKYKIKYLPLFYNDLKKIINYIAYKLENIIAAENILDEINEEIERRAYNPEEYEKYTSIKERENTYYRIYVKNYIIFYVVKDNTMELRRILYSRRNFDNLV